MVDPEAARPPILGPLGPSWPALTETILDLADDRYPGSISRQAPLPCFQELLRRVAK